MTPRMTRDELLRRGAAGVTLLSLPGLLAACGGGDDDGGGGSGGGGGGETNDVLNFSNWELYIDTKKPTTFQQFRNKTGIKVNYFEDVNSNDGYFAKVQGQLRQGQGIGRDIFVATDNSRFPGLYVDQEWVQKLDKKLIPNMSNLIPAQQHPPFDPNRDYSLPWLSGMERGPDGSRHHGREALQRPEAQGQGHGVERDG
jgi:spermidine/putrescine transport system substrate-binding protein